MTNSISENMTIKLSEKSLLMVSLGCAKNLVDSENMCHIIKESGINLVFQPELADIIVINTCGFIESAKKEAIDKILEMSEYKLSLGKCEFIIVTGCLAQRYSEQIEQQIPEVDAILGTSAYGCILDTIKDLYLRKKINASVGTAPIVKESRPLVHAGKAGSLEHLSPFRTPTTKGYAYLKVAEGCSNKCTYCAIPGIRGDFMSRPIEDLINEATFLANNGYYEIVLIAQDTTRYGLDIYGYQALPELIKRISLIDNVKNIRILYCYVDGITPELIDVMATNSKVVHYIEMPIQHANNNVLKRMNRRDKQKKISDTVKALRKAIPDIIIRTTVLVGFPGETDEEFADLLSFIRKTKFDLLGCFVFSPEEGTLAYKMKPKITKRVAQKRYNDIMKSQKEVVEIKNNKKLGKKYQITIESTTDDGVFYLGRTFEQAPEIDPMVLVVSTIEQLEIGKQYLIKIVEVSDYELIGVTI